jgi:phosphoribosylformylglycinamidine synthase
VLGICNGFQVLTEAHLLPGCADAQCRHFLPLPRRAAGGREQPVGLHLPLCAGEEIVIPIAHHDGNYQADKETLDRLEGEGRVAFRYAGECNGSARDIAGIINEAGNVLGMMPHPERANRGGALAAPTAAACSRACSRSSAGLPNLLSTCL